jgi:hypothetical protein
VEVCAELKQEVEDCMRVHGPFEAAMSSSSIQDSVSVSKSKEWKTCHVMCAKASGPCGCFSSIDW